MKAMRVLAKVFIGVGLGLDLMYTLLYLFLVKLVQNMAEHPILDVIFWLLVVYFFGAIVLAVFMYRSIDNEVKSVPLGILGLIFLSIAGGVFYLIWYPEGLIDGTVIDGVRIGKAFEDKFGIDYKQRILKIDDKVIILDDASDVDPPVKKGTVFYVYASNGVEKPWNKRYTKVVRIDKNGKYCKYNFHTYVFKKIGTRSENEPIQ